MLKNRGNKDRFVLKNRGNKDRFFPSWKEDGRYHKIKPLACEALWLCGKEPSVTALKPVIPPMERSSLDVSVGYCQVKG